MVATILQAILAAVLQAVVNYFRARQADADLQEMGYSKSQRDVAVAKTRALDAATAARAKSALDRLTNPGGLRSPDEFSRR